MVELWHELVRGFEMLLLEIFPPNNLVIYFLIE